MSHEGKPSTAHTLLCTIVILLMFQLHYNIARIIVRGNPESPSVRPDAGQRQEASTKSPAEPALNDAAVWRLGTGP